MSEQPSLPGMEHKKPIAIVYTLGDDLHWECTPHPIAKDGSVLLLHCVDPRGGAVAMPIVADADENHLLEVCDDLVRLHWFMCGKHGVRRVGLVNG